MWKKLRGGGVDLEGCKSGSPALRFEATDADIHGAPSVKLKSKTCLVAVNLNLN